MFIGVYSGVCAVPCPTRYKNPLGHGEPPKQFPKPGLLSCEFIRHKIGVIYDSKGTLRSLGKGTCR